jgi:hypothetical protein
MKNVLFGLLAMMCAATTASATPIRVDWSGTATGFTGMISVGGSFFVDSSQLLADLSLNGGVDGVPLTAWASDGVTTVHTTQAPAGPDHDLVLRFTNPGAELFDPAVPVINNDALVFPFSPPAGFAGGSCACEVWLIVLHAVNARHAPSELFIAASPFDLYGTFAINDDARSRAQHLADGELWDSGCRCFQAFRQA